MGSCLSIACKQQRHPCARVSCAEICELDRLPPQVLTHILSLLGQRELFSTIPLVCWHWYRLAKEATQAVQLDLSSPARQLQLPQMMCWLQKHGRNLQQLQLSSSTPLGQTSRRALLHCLQRGAATHAASSSSSSVNGSSQQGHLSLQQLALQMDLDVVDLAYLAAHLRQVAPQLQTLKLQPLKPSLSDLQLLVLACILGNLVGTEAAGPVLPHLKDCDSAVSQLASSMTQLRHLSISRYNISSTACISAATQLSALSLQHCSLTDSMLEGLSSLKQLEKLVLSDNLLSCASLGHLTSLTVLQQLDLSVMPSISRMRSSSKADLHALGKLTALQELNIIGFGVMDAVVVSQLTLLTHLEAGLNPLSAASLQVFGALRGLRHLELGGISQAWVLSSLLPPPETLRAHDDSWLRLKGLEQVTSLDLGGSNWSYQVWSGHICEVLRGMKHLQCLTLAHCHIPAGRLVLLLPHLSHLADLNIDRCGCSDEELAVLPLLTRLTRLSAVSLVPKVGNKQALLLAQLTALRSLNLRNNDVGAKGASALAARLTRLTSLDLSDNPKVGKRCQKQLAHLTSAAESAVALELEESRNW